MKASRPDPEVITAVLAGDREAFGELIDRYQAEFARYAARLLGSEAEAGDVIQDSLVRAYRSLDRCRDTTRFKGWLFRIVRNQCFTRLASRDRVNHAPLEAAAHVAGGEDPAGRVETEQLRHRIGLALKELPADQREAVVMRYIEGLTLPEMAGMVDASVPALKMRLLRARLALREKLEDLFDA
jgi:RNA polymerase sigma-70 factor, ECF subfamily